MPGFFYSGMVYLVVARGCTALYGHANVYALAQVAGLHASQSIGSRFEAAVTATVVQHVCSYM